MSEPIKFWTEVKAEGAHKYPDMKLRLLIRESVVRATEYELGVDEALKILKDEAEYLEHRMQNAK